MREVKELRLMSHEELVTELMSLRKQQFTLRMKKANGSLEKTHVFEQVRRNIARIKTLMTEKVKHDGN